MKREEKAIFFENGQGKQSKGHAFGKPCLRPSSHTSHLIYPYPVFALSELPVLRFFPMFKLKLKRIRNT